MNFKIAETAKLPGKMLNCFKSDLFPGRDMINPSVMKPVSTIEFLFLCFCLGFISDLFLSPSVRYEFLGALDFYHVGMRFGNECKYNRRVINDG